MLNAFRRTRANTAPNRSTTRGIASSLLGLALVAVPVLASSHALAQDAPVITPLGRQLDRMDFSINGSGEFSKSTSGAITAQGATNVGQVVSLKPSNTLGYLITLRYTVKPYLGFEFNYGYARYSENFSNINGAIQANATEYTLGYVAHIPHPFLGAQPWVGVGAGTMAFRPTSGGGQGLSTQARAAYFYAAGLDKPFISPNFGIRVQFRQAFFLAPDFGQNYLTNLQRSYTIEPAAGIYLHF
jgi:hypothetical protein